MLKAQQKATKMKNKLQQNEEKIMKSFSEKFSAAKEGVQKVGGETFFGIRREVSKKKMVENANIDTQASEGRVVVSKGEGMK